MGMDTLIRDLGFLLASASSIEEALKTVLNAVNKIEVIRGAGIYLFNKDSSLLELAKSTGFSESFFKKTGKYDSSKFQYHLVLKGKPVYGCYSKVIGDSHLFKKEKLEQICVIPVKNMKSTVIGSLNAGIAINKNFHDRTKIMLESIAFQLGGAIDRIRTQNDFLISQKNFQSIFESINNFLFITDNSGAILKINPVVETQLGYSIGEFNSMNIADIFFKREGSKDSFALEAILDGKADVYKVMLLSKNGYKITVEAKAVVGKWEGRDAYYIVCNDISKRMVVEEKLRQSEARWQYAMESCGDGLWNWDIKNNKIFISKQWKRIVGYDDHDLDPLFLQQWDKFVHPDDRDNNNRILELHLVGKTPIYRNEHRILCKNGSYKWVLVCGKVMNRDEEGNPERIIGTTIDIEQRKKYENALIESLNKEKKLNELKSRFVSKTSHEFRTPLSTMLLAAESLDNYFEIMTKRDRAKKIKRIKKNIDYLKKVIEKVLDLSHMDSGKVKFEPEKVDISKFIDEIIRENQAIPEIVHNIKLMIPPQPVYICIDKQMIKQVINNILSNSFKYSPDFSAVKVELKVIKSEAIINISDEGIGIDKKDVKEIFEPFYRGSNVSNVKGSGLGLALSKSFVRYNGGNITFSSRAGGGTTFTVTLPGATDNP
jgi:PAS domain S-box-containing protein